ncbi:trigger factor [Chloroflexota bacterium]
MKVTREKTENSQAFLAIEMETEEVEASLAASYVRLAGKTNIPGFRKGKAPRAILERYIGKDNVLEDALNHMLPQVYEKALKEQEITAIAQPNIEIDKTDPVIFKAVVPLPPTVKLGNYHGIKITPEPVETTEDSVDAVMEELRHQYATWEPAERPADFGDLVVLDVESDVAGKSFINQQGVQYQILRNSSSPVPGFADKLTGMKKDEDNEFKLQFPADYPREELAGKESSFKVRIVEVKQECLPELNDELAKQVSPDFATLDSLREQVTTNLKLRAEEKARAAFEEKVIEATVDLAEVEFPPVLVELEIDHLVSEQSRRLQMGTRGLEEYLKSINKTEEELREELRPLATKMVTNSLVLGKVAEEEKVEVTDAEIDADIANMVERATDNKENMQKFLDTERSRESIRQMLITRKTIERLAEVTKSGNTAQAKGKEKKK